MYIKRISEFISDARNCFEKNILDVLDREKGRHCSDSERSSWKETLPVIADILDKLPDNVKKAEIVLEARYSIEEKRADAVIVGTKNDLPVLIIIENKRWSDLVKYQPSGKFCLLDPYHDNRPVSHPCRQVAHYRFTLQHTNGYIQQSGAAILTAVFLQNAVQQERGRSVGLFDSRFDLLIRNNPVFIGHDGYDPVSSVTLSEYIENNIDNGTEGLARRIYSAPLRYSREYSDILANAIGNYNKLSAFLDDMQITMFDEIAKSVIGISGRKAGSREKKVYLIEGDPGTGKTFVAVSLLSYLYRNKRDLKVKLLLKNRDPRIALEREMGICGRAITYGLKGDYNGYDCLICDESHRNLEYVWRGEDDRNTLEAAFQLSNVTVLFYDSQQHVHINDYVTPERIRKAAKNCGISDSNIIQRKLVYQHRCKNSEHYQQFLSGLLSNTDNALDNIKPFNDNEEYKVALAETPEILFDIIKAKNNISDNSEKSSRVLAGKGRTDSKDWSWWRNDEECVPTIGPFRNSERKFMWNRRNYTFPDTFASDSDSVDLVGCIDTSQGLDFKYAGVIIAPDLIYNPTDRRVEVAPEGHQQVDPNTASGKNADPDDIKTIILNTYRVLLTRGEKGCYIYCCDENLQNYLATVLPVIRSANADDSRAHTGKDIHPDESGKKVRHTGTVRYVDSVRRFAYIKDDNGEEYVVCTSTYDRIEDPEKLLSVGSRVRFTVYTNRNGKKYANDIIN